MAQASRPLALVTGAASGIGLELAKIASTEGYDVVVVDRDALIHGVASRLQATGSGVYPILADLATLEGVEMVHEEVESMRRPVELLFANAGHGLGHAFVDQDFEAIRDVIDTNVTGTVYVIHKFARAMRDRGRGRVLVTGSVAGFIPGTYQAVYNASKAFIDSFTNAVRNELAGSGVSVTCLMPGATDTRFFEAADMMDTKVGTAKKDDPADVARAGWSAMMRGEASVIYGLKNKMQVAAAKVMPQDAAAALHAKQAAPGTARK
jgi:short-subunit dehydrogenase